MRYELDHEAIQNIFHNPEGMVGAYFKRMGAKLRMLAVMQAGLKTGQTKARMYFNLATSGQGLILTVGSTSKVALWHHQGTGRHPITPKFAKTLRFKVNGRIVYAKAVNHPGTRPNRYLTDNLRRVL